MHLTEQKMTTYSSGSDSIGAGAPSSGTEIEITPAMLRAGVSALCAYDSEFESREEGVERIFRAMCRASQKYTG
jgi:hypothetical protein